MAQPPITDVPATARLCLLLMAKLAHDDTGLYWGGVAFLQINLGYPPGPIGRRRVMALITRLEDAGYVRRTYKRRGRNRVYELVLRDLGRPVDYDR